jgi:hypothetical protein
MKHLKTFEGILKTESKRYYVIKRHKNNFIGLIETYPMSGYVYINVRAILPETSSMFMIFTDEIAINTYQDEFRKECEFLYSSTNLEEATEQYDLYKSAYKYNL